MNTAINTIGLAGLAAITYWLKGQLVARPITNVIATWRTYTWDTRGLTPWFAIGLIAASIVSMIYVAEIAPWCWETIANRVAAEAAGL